MSGSVVTNTILLIVISAAAATLPPSGTGLSPGDYFDVFPKDAVSRAFA